MTIKSSDNKSHDGKPKTITGLAMIPRETILNEAALAEAMAVSPRTIRRRVDRGELPPPFSMSGSRHWIVGTVLDWFSKKAVESAARAEAENSRLAKYESKMKNL